MKYLLEHHDWLGGSDLTDFLEFCKSELGYSTEPNIELSDDLDHAKQVGSMGHFDPETRVIWVYRGRRVKADWYRTLAHELVHHAQRERGSSLDGSTGSETENEANSMAGVILRAWGKRNPEIFESASPSKFFNKMRLAKLGLADADDIAAHVWFPICKWRTSDYREHWVRLKVQDLLGPQDFENLDSLRAEDVIWYTDPTPGTSETNYEPGEFLRIIGPSSSVKRVKHDIQRILEEAVYRLAAETGETGYDVSGWGEAIWYMTEPELNASWGSDQPRLFKRWAREVGLE